MRNKNTLFLLFSLLSCSYLNAQLATRQEKGFFNITNIAELHLMRSIDSAVLENGNAMIKSGFAANTINGIFLNPNFSIGLGVGVQFSNYRYTVTDRDSDEKIRQNGPEITVLPLFADFRYYPRNSINTALFILDVGYAPVLHMSNANHKSYLNGGPFVQIGTGYKIYLGPSVSFLPSVNFRAQRFGDNTVVGLVVGAGFML